MGVTQGFTNLLPDVQHLLARLPLEYMHDLALDLAQAALIAPRRPDALYQVIREWEITLEEIDLAGDELADILQARQEPQAGVGMRPNEPHAYL
jgi:non-ribosomal peptide synthetase component F